MNNVGVQRLPASGYRAFLGNPIRAEDSGISLGLVALYSLHIPLAVLMYQFQALATLHAVTAVLFGLWYASRRRLFQVAYCGAYIAGSEVMWRMCHAQVFWEIGKYGMAAVFIVAVLRSGNMKGPALPFLYFVLLLPSVGLTIAAVDLTKAQDMISFNLSGPFALMISAWFFSRMKLKTEQLHRLFLALIGPSIGVATIALFAMRSAADLTFSNNSNFATSGGFGPNQVSNALGLGTLLTLFLVLDKSTAWKVRLVMFAAVLFLAAQSALTFSRGGLYTAVGSAGLASLYLIRDRQLRVKVLMVGLVLYMTINYILLPRLDSYTGGALSTRFETTNMTGRDRIALAELEVWKQNPVFGVGPGEARSWTKAVAHTEMTRLVAEHGTFGFAALLLLLVAGVQNIRRAPTLKSKAILAAMVGWSFLFMLNAGMRLVAPAFTFGLSFAALLLEDKKLPFTAIQTRHYKNLEARIATKARPFRSYTKARSDSAESDS